MEKDLISKLRKYEIQIRKAVNAQMQGDFHSVFKGSGLEFDDIRQYQYGDDVRTVNWNVSAKGDGAYVNTFKEEKEQNVFFVVDVSASQEIGVAGAQKIDIAKEVAGVLMLSAAKEQSSVGLLCYSDRKECYIRPGKGVKHAYQLLNAVFDLKPASRQTNLADALGLCLNMLKRKSLVVLLSDFIDENFERTLKAIAKRHDLVVVHLSDRRETLMPSMGIVPLLDKESGQMLWINTESEDFRASFERQLLNKKQEITSICRRFGANYLFLETSQDYVPELIKLFKIRNRTRK
ncbi:MAG: DUF58 domain-containing protein [Cytophagales bacterium]|nr:MAG: DUF58 domain-containing protein [Cytophagales bacterium]TAF61338.1 MAG: DUF58 domain-containing protein [Cytophagales bacterium]